MVGHVRVPNINTHEVSLRAVVTRGHPADVVALEDQVACRLGPDLEHVSGEVGLVQESGRTSSQGSGRDRRRCCSSGRNDRSSDWARSRCQAWCTNSTSSRHRVPCSCSCLRYSPSTRRPWSSPPTRRWCLEPSLHVLAAEEVAGAAHRHRPGEVGHSRPRQGRRGRPERWRTRCSTVESTVTETWSGDPWVSTAVIIV